MKLISIGISSIIVAIILLFSLSLVNKATSNEELTVSAEVTLEIVDDEFDSTGQNEVEHVVEEFTPIFKKKHLTDDIVKKITGVSWQKDAPVSLEDLSYLKLTYWDFDGKEQIGELIVHRKVGLEVVEIFQELYEAEYPIAKMRLVDEYDADDNLSMHDNNTYGFSYRVVAGTQVISSHGYGLAIDINPIQNPYIAGDTILPPEAEAYFDRDDVRKGMIVEGDPAYKAFKSRGWTWGGDWTRIKDYHHFQKDIDLSQ